MLIRGLSPNSIFVAALNSGKNGAPAEKVLSPEEGEKYMAML